MLQLLVVRSFTYWVTAVTVTAAAQQVGPPINN